MVVNFLKEQSVLNEGKTLECIFCLENNQNELRMFVCDECKNSCHFGCILSWLGGRVKQSCPFCRKIIWESGEEKK